MKNYLLGLTFVVLLSSCGGGGGGGGDSEPSGPTTPAPSVSLSADPTSVLLNNVSTLTWSSSNANSCSAAWTSSNATSGSEQVTITGIGNNTFTITCSGDGGSRNASVTVEGYRNTDGVVVDGYISGAEVCIDENDNWTCDTNESNTNSDNEGKFAIKYANGNLISIGGTDLDTQTLLDNFLITHKLTGNIDFMAVTPVTSVAAFMTQSSSINAALGIDPSIDVFTFDPVSNKGDGGINDYLYEKGNQLTVLALALQNISNNINTTSETTEDYFKAISEEIENEYNETQIRVDIETEGFVSKVLENIISSKSLSISDESKSNTSKALSGVMPIIQVKSSENLTTSIIRFAISTLQNDIQTIANGTASSDIISSYTNDILNFIASDQSINADDLIPDIIAISDVATTSEDTNIDINVLLNDSYVTSSPFSLSSTDAINGSTSISNNLITYSPDADFNGSDSFSYTITQGSKTATADVDVTVEPVNDAPSIDIPSTIQVAENQTSVTTVSVSDVDGDDLTLTLGGTDADSFNLSDENVLTFKEAPSYATKSSYSITLDLTDGTETVTKDISILIIIPDAPYITSDPVFSVAENQTSIGTVIATDPQGDSFTFAISGDEITINSAGELNFVTAPDYEIKTTYTATITVTDSEDNSSTQTITINVTNVNDNNPVFTSNSSFSAEENQTSIGTATATDADGDAVTFSVTGSELSVTSAGVLSFVTAPDYETKSSYMATLNATDGANTSTQEITINVINLNDNTPAFTSSDSFSVDENLISIGSVVANDADGDDLSYSISGEDASSISINSTSGALTFVSAPNYESKTSYSITALASDGLNEITQDISIIINNVDEAPVFTSSSTFSADENQTSIGSVTALDPENSAVSFSIDGTDAEAIEISSDGVLSFVSAPNYESKNSYTVRVNVSDGANTNNQTITVNVTDVNDAPVANAASYYLNLLPQDQSGGDITLGATDEDGDTLTYSIVSDATYGTTSISGSTLTYTTLSSTQSAQSESFTFKVNDGTADSDAATISIDLRTDPLYQYQWHLNNTGQTNFATNSGTAGQDLNVDSVIVDGYTGNGVKISIIDEDLEIAHEDLVDNVINGSWDFIGSDNDPTKSSTCTDNDTCGGHGTSIAGVMAAKGWNNIGVRGIAPNASIIGYNWLQDGNLNNLISSLGVNPPGGVAADIYNMSFGNSYPDDEVEYNLPQFLLPSVEDAFINGVNNLRNGKGAIYVWAAGNDYDTNSLPDVCGTDESLSCAEMSIDELNGMPYLIPVGALDADGLVTTYTTPGSAMWVSGFAGEYGTNYPATMTVDRTSCSAGYVSNGYSSYSNVFDNPSGHPENPNCNYTSSFNGTSTAAPTVGGVIALMLEANPDLTWRDVKHILVTTSEKIDVDRTYSLSGVTQYSWIENSAGHEHHNWYGFGKVNAAEAVSAAKTITPNNLGAFVTTDFVLGTGSGTIPDNDAGTVSHTITKPSGSNGVVEFVRISIDFNHAQAWSLGLRLQSPDGTVVNLMQPFTNVSNPGGGYWIDIGASAFYGESMEGTWTLELRDYASGTTGTLNKWGIEVYGN